MSSQYSISTAQVQSVLYLCNVFPYNTSSVQLMSSLYPIFIACVKAVSHVNMPISVSTPPLLPMSSQYITSVDIVHIQSSTTSSAHVQSEYHIFCPCPVRIPPLLLMSYQYIISLDPIPPEYHLSWPSSISKPSLLLMASQITNSPRTQNVLLLAFATTKSNVWAH